MLVHLGVLDLSSAPGSLGTAFPSHSAELETLLGEAQPKSDVIVSLPKEPPIAGPSLTVKESFILRAAAIDACEQIIECARSLDASNLGDCRMPQEILDRLKGMTLQELDLWLWGVAKDRSDYRRLERFSVTDTIMF